MSSVGEVDCRQSGCAAWHSCEVSSNEFRFAANHPDSYCLYRILAFDQTNWGSNVAASRSCSVCIKALMLSSSSERNTRPGAGDNMKVPYWSRVTSPMLVFSRVIFQWLESIAVNWVSSMSRPSKVTLGDGSVSPCSKGC